MARFIKGQQDPNYGSNPKVGAGYADKLKALLMTSKSPYMALRIGVSPAYALLVLTLNFILISPATHAEENYFVHRETIMSRQSLEDSMPRRTAIRMISEYGWEKEEFICLDKLWQRESGWNHKADNPHSSAFGIAQMLNETATDPVSQIRNGLRYISNRYETPCNAWAFWLQQKAKRGTGWY